MLSLKEHDGSHYHKWDDALEFQVFLSGLLSVANMRETCFPQMSELIRKLIGDLMTLQHKSTALSFR